jgi:hypothetical protein
MRVLMVSPHFPPDSSAGTHRVRLVAPHLAAYGWEPTVVTVEAGAGEGRSDPGLAELVPPSLAVRRCAVPAAQLTRRVGIGDLGLRSLYPLGRLCAKILSESSHHAVFITIYPTYTALLGPWLRRRFGLVFILDYQDPWVSNWGLQVGGGQGGRVDLKSRLARQLARVLEPATLRAADGLSAVSRGTWDGVVARHSWVKSLPFREIPIGFEPADLTAARRLGPPALLDGPAGVRHFCYVGTLLPLGVETVRAFLRALARRRARGGIGSARFHFVGTSNQSTGALVPRVLPLAVEAGVADLVMEHPARVPFLEALRLLVHADGILLFGSTEAHYTPSKLFPALWAGRPLLASYHAASSALRILAEAADPARTVTIAYDDQAPPAAHGEVYEAAIARLLQVAGVSASPREAALAPYTARATAARLASLLDEAHATRRARCPSA